MKVPIAIVDYGAGNLFSVANALGAVGAPYRFAERPEDLEGAAQILLPGVGHFGQFCAALEERGLREGLVTAATQGGSILGICLGMQALFSGSEEAPEAVGLNLLKGRCARLPGTVRTPHMGWNLVDFSDRDSGWFYFSHTYAVSESEASWARTQHGIEFIAAVRRGNLWGFQFHPEKSGANGLELLKEWVDAG